MSVEIDKYLNLSISDQLFNPMKHVTVKFKGLLKQDGKTGGEQQFATKRYQLV